jgi:hypothetical protein
VRRLALIVRDPDGSLTAFTGKVGKKATFQCAWFKNDTPKLYHW